MILWKVLICDGEETLYMINEYGDIKSRKNKNKRLRHSKNQKGYHLVTLYINGKRKTKQVHRLVAYNFITYDLENKEVHHKDRDKDNNHVSNLEVLTHDEHVLAERDMCIPHVRAKGENHGNCKYTEEVIKECCALLQRGYGLTRVSEITGVGIDTVYRIHKRQRWCHISKDYDF